nr:uncharacterized protein LOC129166825 [Nothobranchius furzeri]
MQAPTSVFLTPTPTPPPTPLTLTAAACSRPFSSRRSPSYESSISLKDLAPSAPFEQTQSSFFIHCSSCSTQPYPSSNPWQSPAFPFMSCLTSPIPLITSPLPSSPAPYSSPFSATSAPTSPASCPASPTLSTPVLSQAETVTLSLTLSGSSEDLSCQTVPSIKTPTTPSILSVSCCEDHNSSQLIAALVSPTLPSSPCMASPSVTASASKDSLAAQLASSSRPISPLSICTLPPISPSGSRCPSPGPPSPPIRSLSPCPVCQCKCAPSVNPSPALTHIDPSKMEIYI